MSFSSLLTIIRGLDEMIPSKVMNKTQGGWVKSLNSGGNFKMNSWWSKLKITSDHDRGKTEYKTYIFEYKVQPPSHGQLELLLSS